jgi:hypothetical protein
MARMRAFLLAVAILGIGCASDTLGEDTAYRRLIDGFASYDACITNGQFADCYQTLTLCHDGRARMTLEIAPQEGKYLLDEPVVTARFLTMTVVFDLEKATSAQLPGEHPWELVEPIATICTP